MLFEWKILLVHLILSHHGKQEYGAVTLPAIPEALVLSHVDDLDAKMYVFDETYNELNPGEVTEKKNFMLGTKLYRSYSVSLNHPTSTQKEKPDV